MEKNRDTFYVTTPIFYANGRPHLGHVFAIFVADVLARYHRLRGDNTFFLTGMDEHGTKVARSAEEQGKTPQEWVDEVAVWFQDAAHHIESSHDIFHRTTNKEKHWPVAQEIWRRLETAGDIYKKEYKGLYCVGCEAFITEKDLDENGLCPDHGIKPEIVSEENYFFRLSKYQQKLLDLIVSDTLHIVPQERKNEVVSFVQDGLEDISFSRKAEDLKNWGVPVPGDSAHLMYVWADALTNYLSGIDYFSNKEEAEFWPADVHVLGKEILRFHAVYWPAMLLASDIPLPKQILCHGQITSGGYKMSKTRGNVVDPFEYIGKHGAEALRYYLAAGVSTLKDGDFTHEQFVRRYNGDLAKGLGNVTARILTLAESVDFSGITEKPSEITEAERFKKVWEDYGEAFAAQDLRAAIGTVWELIHWMDGHIEKTKPWESKDVNVLYTLCVALANVSWLLRPFLPETAEKIEQGLGIAGKETWEFAPTKIDPLFPKIEQ